MKNRPILLLGLLGMLVIPLIAAIPRQTVSAQDCFDPITQQKINCPEEEKSRPTVIYPSFTPTATETSNPLPTTTPTLTPIPTPIPVDAAPTPTDAGGFSCYPYRSGAPIGAAALAAGALALTLARPGGLLDPNKSRYSGFARQHDSAPAEVSRTAIPMEGSSAGGGGSGVAPFFMRLVSRLSPRDPASGLPSMNQGSSAATGAARLIGTAVAGAGGGVLGAALLGGLFDFSCLSSNVMLPVGAMLGLMAALAASLLLSNADRVSPFAPIPDPDEGGGFSTFELVGVINETYADGPSGTAGIYREKDLE